MNTFQFVVFKSFNMQDKEIKREKEAQKNVWHKKGKEKEVQKYRKEKTQIPKGWQKCKTQ